MDGVTRTTRWPALLRRISAILLSVVPGFSAACDAYDFNNNLLTIPTVLVGNTMYSNVVVHLLVAQVRSYGSATGNSSTSTIPDFYDSATGLLTVACVTVGTDTFTNVIASVGADDVVGVGRSGPGPTKPFLLPTFPMPDAVVGTAYDTSTAFYVSPPNAAYTYAIDTLAGSATPPGMTINMNGRLSGTAFATGAADINGRQIAHTYTFGVCAIDTFTRLSSTPCPQTHVTVRPVSVTVAIVGNGSVSPSPGGNACGANCYSGYARGANVTLSANPASGSTFTGWSGACSGSGACVLTASGTMNVVATFTQAAAGGLTGTWSGTANQPGAGYDGCPVRTVNWSFTLVEDASNHVTGTTAGGAHITGARAGNIVTVMEQDDRYGSFGPYTWTSNGSNTLTGTTLYYCYDLDSLALQFVGASTFSVTRQ